MIKVPGSPVSAENSLLGSDYSPAAALLAGGFPAPTTDSQPRLFPALAGPTAQLYL